MSDTPRPLDDGTLDRIATLWMQLQAAAQSGDRRAQGFLQMFGPWAAAQMQSRTRQ